MSLALAVTLWGQSAGAESTLQKITELMRGLRQTEDRLASGDPAAYKEWLVLMQQGEQVFRKVTVDEWKDDRVSQSMLVYTLSGASSSVMRRIMADGSIGHVDRNLKRLILILAETRKDEVGSALDAIALASLDAALSVPIALAAATMLHGEKDYGVGAVLEAAAIRWPGTSIEEGALRRLIVLSVRRGALDDARRLTAKYARRFPASIFAGALRKRLIAEIAVLPHSADANAIELLKSVAPSSEMAAEFYLAAARQFLIKSRVGIAKEMASLALELSKPETLASERAQLYFAASSAPMANAPSAATDLDRLKTSNLDGTDEELRRAALLVARQVATSVSTQEEGGARREGRAEVSIDDLKTRAKRIFDQVDEARQ